MLCTRGRGSPETWTTGSPEPSGSPSVPRFKPPLTGRDYPPERDSTGWGEKVGKPLFDRPRCASVAHPRSAGSPIPQRANTVCTLIQLAPIKSRYAQAVATRCGLREYGLRSANYPPCRHLNAGRADFHSLPKPFSRNLPCRPCKERCNRFQVAAPSTPIVFSTDQGSVKRRGLASHGSQLLG